MDRRRIIFLINSLTGGGAERVMCTLLRHSEQECEEFDVTLALLDNEPAANAPPEWVKVRQLDGRKSALDSVVAVRRLFAEETPALSLSFLTRSNVANVVNARHPCIISERANTTAHFAKAGIGGMAARTIVRTAYPRAARIIAVSDGVGRDLVQNFGIDAGKVVAIPNPLDLARITAKADETPALAIDGPYIMAAGRLVAAKNFAMLIRAFAASGVGGTLLIAGEGPERAALTALAVELGVANRVVLPGFIANPYPLMRSADVFVLSSNAEGFPNALVEAMALGRPVVAVNCASGPSEILAERTREEIAGLTFAQHGVLTTPNDAAMMSVALRAMVAPARRAEYAQKAAARAGAYSAETIKNRYWDVVREALAR